MRDAVKFNLRLPRDLRQEASAHAERMGISLNALVTIALRNFVDYQTRTIAQTNRVLAATDQRRRSKVAKVGRNDPCPCDSGRKYKHCHGA